MTDRNLTLDALARVPASDVPAALLLLAAVQTELAARLAAGSPPEPEQPDELLSADEAARRTGMSKRWLYAHADELSFAIRTSARSLRFSSRGIDRWLARRALNRSRS